MSLDGAVLKLRYHIWTMKIVIGEIICYLTVVIICHVTLRGRVEWELVTLCHHLAKLAIGIVAVEIQSFFLSHGLA